MINGLMRDKANKKKPSNYGSVSAKKINEMNTIIDLYNVNTICNSGLCPNRGLCFKNKQLTFMLLGNVCTRNCKYCNVPTGKPEEIDMNEPENVAKTIKELNLDYVVLTSVTRDDLKDGGAEHFANVIFKIREICKNDIKIEVLIPDFRFNAKALDIVINAKPDVINHNIEVCQRLFPTLRPLGRYSWALDVLKYVKKHSNITTKSGLMLGFGEDIEEIEQTLIDLNDVGIDIVTIGQYLPPNSDSFKLVKEYTSCEFKEIKNIANKMNFQKTYIDKNVRSSFNAKETSCLDELK